MKKYILLITCAILGFSGCNNITTEDPSIITFFIQMELQGDEVMFVTQGTAFVDPGVVAIQDGNDVSSIVKVKSNLDINKIGMYEILYTATNEDGIANSLTRTVCVYDGTPSTLVSSVYYTDKNSSRSYNGATVTFGKSYPVIIYQTEPGVFFVSDFFGGWYDKRAGYGSSYAMVGKFRLNKDNTITYISSSIDGFGDSLTGLNNGKLDTTTVTISWEALYVNGMVFHLTLNK